MMKRQAVKVVKYGGSLFTHKELKPPCLGDILDRPEIYVNVEAIRRAAEETLSAIEFFEKTGQPTSLWLGHGVGQYGHDAVGFLGVTPEVRRYCGFLNRRVVKIFRDVGVPVETVDLAETCWWDGMRFFIEAFVREGRGVLERGKVPITFGTVVDAPRGYKIISTDDFVVLTAETLRADQALMFTDVEVCDKDPKKFDDAKPLRVVRSHLDISASVDERDKTGSIIEKIRKMESIARKGIECRIIDGQLEWNIFRALIGEKVGALIKPEQ